MKTVYEQMALAGNVVSQQVRTEGDAPDLTFVLHIKYANGLCVSYDGSEKGFQVVKAAQ